MVEVRNVFIVLLIVVSVIAAVMMFTGGGTFSVTQTIDFNGQRAIEWNTEEACKTTSQCLALEGFPADGYCKEGTCRFIEPGVQRIEVSP